jgi:DNA modification methylase
MLSLRPMVIDENNVVLGGNMRLRALQELGFNDIDEAWVKRSSNLTEEEKNRFIIADNVAFGEWDWDTLANDWEVVDLEAWGLEIPQFDTVEELEASEDDYEVPEGGMETDIVIGDLFEIGEHRLLCGDSTDSDAVARLMNGEKADMVFTDPPYGINVVQGDSVGGCKLAKVNTYSKIIGDETTDTAKAFYNTCISLGMENFIIWGGNYFTDFLPVSACWVIWDKENSGNFADVEIAWTSFDKGSKLYKWMWNGMSRKGSRELEGKTRVHPTQKPVGLFGDIFNDFPFQICFDGFLGSGSTMVAAHQLKRRCYGMELEPKYCAVIIDRMRKLDSSLIIKRNGKQI